MEKFIVSARKYRPQNFGTVVGQDHITTTLKNAIKNNQLAHAFLFCGPRGVGKTTCARILAKTINCENRTPEGEACNECPSCISFNKGTSLNIHELDAASNNSVEDIRALVDQVRFAPQAGKYRVYIVDEVHMLSTSAFNAFLKTLEEPPPYAIFILATTEKHKILPTILSRCQIFDFKRMTNPETVHHLREICEKEHIHADETALHLIAQKGEGCMRDSLSLFDKIVSFTNGDVSYKNTLLHLNILDEDYYFSLLEMMQQQKLSDVLLTFDEINRKGFEGDIFLNGFAEFFRNLLVCKDPKVVSLLEVAEDFKPKYEKATKKISFPWLISAINIISEAEIELRKAKNKKLHTELTLIKLCYLNQVIEISQEGVVKKKPSDSTSGISFRSLIPQLSPQKSDAPTKKIKKSPSKKPAETSMAKLMIETPHAQKPRQETPPVGMAPQKLMSLAEIQKAVHEEYQSFSQKALTHEELTEAWNNFVGKFEKDKQITAAESFKNAVLKIKDENLFEIVTANEFHQHFIEAERRELTEHLQTWFNNRKLTFTIKLEPKDLEGKKEEYLSAREKYLKMIQDYPAVKALKEKLGLRLEL